jgi:AI-2 transport system permease protein
MSQILKYREAVVIALLVALVLVIGVFSRASSAGGAHQRGQFSLVLMPSPSADVHHLDAQHRCFRRRHRRHRAVVLGTVLNLGVPLPIGIVLALLMGLRGMVNAIGVTFFRVPPIIMTLGTLGVAA